MKVVKELETVEIRDRPFPRHRVVVLLRDDGFYTYADEYYYVAEYEGRIVAQGWARLPAYGIHETAEIAEREARAAYSTWYPPKSESDETAGE